MVFLVLSRGIGFVVLSKKRLVLESVTVILSDFSIIFMFGVTLPEAMTFSSDLWVLIGLGSSLASSINIAESSRMFVS